MNATVRLRCEDDACSAPNATLTLNAGELRLKASLSDGTLSLEKPGHFLIDYSLPKKVLLPLRHAHFTLPPSFQDVRFQFTDTVRVLARPVILAYTHAHGDGSTALDVSAALDPAHKLGASYALGGGDCRVRYAYAHGELRRTVFEPCYDVTKNAWEIAVTRKVESGDTVKATYNMSSRMLGLEWNQQSKINPSFKVSASMNLMDQPIAPKLKAETTWNFTI